MEGFIKEIVGVFMVLMGLEIVATQREKRAVADHVRAAGVGMGVGLGVNSRDGESQDSAEIPTQHVRDS